MLSFAPMLPPIYPLPRPPIMLPRFAGDGQQKAPADHWTHGNNHFRASNPAALQALQEAPIGDSTRESYARALARFDRWRAARQPEPGQPTDPPTDVEIAEYVIDLDQRGQAVSSSRTAVSALRAAGVAIGPLATRAVRWHARSAAGARAVRQAVPMNAGDVAAIVRTACRPRRAGRGRESAGRARHRGIGDIAMAGLLFGGLMRRSEVAALRRADVTPAPAPAGEIVRARVHVRRSKGDPQGLTRDVRIVTGAPAVAALELAAAGDPGERLIGPKTGGEIGRRLRAAADAAGIGWKGLTGHSGRVGGAQALCRRNVSLPAISVAGKWKSPSTVLGYLAALDAESTNVAAHFAALEAEATAEDSRSKVDPGEDPGRVLPFRPPRP